MAAHNFKDLTGKKFSRLSVIRRAGNAPRGKVRWECTCDCGNILSVRSDSLASGNTKSCGCFHVDRTVESSTRHGMSRTRVHRTWIGMLSRCNDKNDTRYGGRGICVCERWQVFENFFADMGYPPSASHSIERLDNNGNYGPGNCCWATTEQQANNRRTNRIITFDSRSLNVKQWSGIVGISASLIIQRIDKLGWSEERALTQKVRR